MIVSIHQPNFMPWLPFFRKIQACDVFVILTNCQYEKNGYQNRFNKNGAWYTMSVKSGMLPINQKLYANPLEDWNKIKRTFPNLNIFDEYITSSLADTNIKIIRKIAAILGIKTRIELDWPTSATSTARLVEICKQFGATEYLAGASGGNYMDAQMFDDNKIKIITQQIIESDKVSIVEYV